MLDDRAKLLLKTLVNRYIADGQPVGSRTLSRAAGLELSPATIRNVMSDLEALGLVAVRLDETWAEHQLYLCRRTDSPLPPAAARLFAHLADTATVQA